MKFVALILLNYICWLTIHPSVEQLAKYFNRVATIESCCSNEETTESSNCEKNNENKSKRCCSGGLCNNPFMACMPCCGFHNETTNSLVFTTNNFVELAFPYPNMHIHSIAFSIFHPPKLNWLIC